MPFLIAYTTTHGHTARIASRIAQRLGERGLDVELADLATHHPVSPQDYAGVVVGASVHVGRHQASVERWLKEHRTTIALRPSALFSVSLMAMENIAESRATARAYIDDLVEETGWSPDRAESFAGALQYREYDRFTRLLVRAIARRHGGSIDTAHDHDYTDWSRVDAYAGELATLFGAVPAEIAA